MCALSFTGLKKTMQILKMFGCHWFEPRTICSTHKHSPMSDDNELATKYFNSIFILLEGPSMLSLALNKPTKVKDSLYLWIFLLL